MKELWETPVITSLYRVTTNELVLAGCKIQPQVPGPYPELAPPGSPEVADCEAGSGVQCFYMDAT